MARALEKSHEGARGFHRDLVAVVFLEHGQRKVEPGGEARRRPQFAIARVDVVGLDAALRIALGHHPGSLPVRGDPLVHEQARFRQQEGAGADAANAGHLAAFARQPRHQVGGNRRVRGRPAAGHDQGADALSGDLRQGLGGHADAR
ncbi:hypothetical protein D3C72_1729190 [compost metagenome]